MFADNRARPAFRTSVDLEEGMVSGPHLDHKSGSMVHMLLLLAWKAVLWSGSRETPREIGWDGWRPV